MFRLLPTINLPSHSALSNHKSKSIISPVFQGFLPYLGWTANLFSFMVGFIYKISLINSCGRLFNPLKQ
jgi:hypothetical protein